MSEDFKRQFSLKFFFTLIVMKLKFDHIGQVFAIKTTDDHQLLGFIVWRTWLSVKKKKKKFMTIHQIVVWWIAGSFHLHLMVFLSQRPSLKRERGYRFLPICMYYLISRDWASYKKWGNSICWGGPWDVVESSGKI